MTTADDNDLAIVMTHWRGSCIRGCLLRLFCVAHRCTAREKGESTNLKTTNRIQCFAVGKGHLGKRRALLQGGRSYVCVLHLQSGLAAATRTNRMMRRDQKDDAPRPSQSKKILERLAAKANSVRCRMVQHRFDRRRWLKFSGKPRCYPRCWEVDLRCAHGYCRK